MANAEVPLGNMPGGQGGGCSTFSVKMSADAVSGQYFSNKAMTRDEAVDALTGDAGTYMREFLLDPTRDVKIEKVKFKTGNTIVTNALTGEKTLKNSVYFTEFANRSIQDTTNHIEEGGKLRARVDRIATTIATNQGEVAWFSPEENGDDRLYIAKSDGKGDGALYSIKVEHKDINSMWNFLDTLNGKKNDRNGNIKDVLVVRDHRKGDKALQLEDAVLSYVDSLNFDERRSFSPNLHKLGAEAVIPEEMRDKRIAEQKQYVKGEVEKLLENKDTQEALGIIGQSLATWARKLDEQEQRHVNNASVMPTRQQAVQKPQETKPVYTVINTRKKVEKNYKFLIGKNEGFRSSGFKSMLRQTGGIKLIPYWRHRLNVSEVGGEILTKVQNKVSRKQERLHYHDSISATSIFVSSDKKKRGEKIIQSHLQLKGAQHEKKHIRKRQSQLNIALSSKDRVHIPLRRRRVVESSQTSRKRKTAILFERRVTSKAPRDILKPVSSRRTPLEYAFVRGIKKRFIEKPFGLRLEGIKSTQKREKRAQLTLEKRLSRFKTIRFIEKSFRLRLEGIKSSQKREKRIVKKELLRAFVQKEKKRFNDFMLKPREFIRGMIGHFKKEILQKRRKMRRELRSYKRYLRFTEFLRRGLNKDILLKVNRETFMLKIKRSRYFRKLILGFYGKDSKQYADLRHGKISRGTFLRIERFIRGRISHFERVRLYERSVFGRILLIFRLIEKRYKQSSKKILPEKEHFTYDGKKTLLKDFWLIFQLKRELDTLLLLIDTLLTENSKPVLRTSRKLGKKHKSREERLARLYAGKRKHFPRKGIVFSFNRKKALFVSA